VVKKLWRLEQPYPRNCMDKLILNADKMQTNRKERYGKVEASSNQGEYIYRPGNWSAI